MANSLEELPFTDSLSFTRLENGSIGAANQMHEAWSRPVRHNRRIERAALWHAIHVDTECRGLLERHRGESFVTPPLPDSVRRYDIEAAVRTIPDLIVFTKNECDAIRSSRHPRDAYFEADGYEFGKRGIGITQPELLARWHEWLWLPKEPGKRAAEPNPEAEALAVGYARLAQGMLGALAVWEATES